MGESAVSMRVGCGQITWSRASEEEALRDISQAGYEGAAPKLRVDQPPEATIQTLSGWGLKPAPPYFSAEFWKPELREGILGSAREAARFTRGIGCTELYVATGGGNVVAASGRTRRQLAGHVGEGDGLPDADFRRLAEVLTEVAAITLAEGVRSCFHNHVGSVVETEAEYERLIELSGPEVFLGPDTGHLAWAGGDVPGFFRRHIDRILTTHLKDIDGEVLARGRKEEWDYPTFSDRGIFTELGRGFVDIADAVDQLRGAGFDGWVIVETDVTQLPTAAESARVSREYLHSIGL
ncbi:MAG TPA: sugar phosphate isomerase/epimerase [Candidatus Dormibacteraeota bacterium]|jgi:inosose dehydratase|nr:sugar phosphate isomerase/epimerase [Candidatus Dormibacteraeota bacterium]